MQIARVMFHIELNYMWAPVAFDVHVTSCWIERHKLRFGVLPKLVHLKRPTRQKPHRVKMHAKNT